MAHQFLITRAIPHQAIDLLSKHGTVTVNPHDRVLHPEEIIDMGRSCDGWLTMLTDIISKPVLEECTNLRGISNYAVGFNNIDIATCTARGIGAANTPDVLTEATAELAWALILACCRRVVEADACVRSGAWRGWAPLEFMGAGVTGKTLGIVGAGRIGTRVAEMSRGFTMPVVYSGRRRNQTLEASVGAKYLTFHDLLTQADIISLHLPLTDDTRHLIGAQEFARMKPSAILINTGRGPLIHETALVAALRHGQIAAAGLDVFEHEPQIASGLTELANVVLLPHIGSATVETRTRMAVMASENLLAMVEGRCPAHPLNPQIYHLPGHS